MTPATTLTQGPELAQALEVLTLRGGYNTNSVIIGATLLGIAAGVVGVFAMLRKRALMSDALSHATLPGIAGAYLIATLLGFDGKSLPLLLIAGATTGILGVLAIQAILHTTRLKEDAATGIVLSVFFGAGIVLLSVVQQRPTGNAAGLSAFLYGQTAAMITPDARLMGIIAIIAITITALFMKEFALVCFNEGFARAQGLPITLIDLLMMGLVVVVTVAGLQAVGLILVVALLIVPAVSARFWTDRLWWLLALAGVIGGLSGYLGASVSALLPRKPAGAVIVLTAGVFFAVSLILAPKRGILNEARRRAALRLRFAREHLLEALYERPAQGPMTKAELRALAHELGWNPLQLRGILLLATLRREIRTTPQGIELTQRGTTSGARIHRNHTLWEQYLVSYADVAPSHVDWSVDQVEHVLSPELITRLETALQRRGISIPKHEVQA